MSRNKPANIEKLINLADHAFRKERFKEAAGYYKSSRELKPFFYPLFMETISHYLGAELAPFKRIYRILQERYQDNRYLRELQCFISFKKDSIDKVLENWVTALETYPASRKIKRAINKLRKEKDPLLWKRHSRLQDFVSIPPKNFRPHFKHSEPDAENDRAAMVKDKLISGLRSWIAPGKEGKVYHQYWIFFRKFFSIISLLLFIFLAVRSIQIGISKGFSGLEDYWHYLANQTQSALSFLKFSNAGHQDEKGFSSAGKTENNSESKGLTGANEEGLRKDEHLKSILGSEKNGSPDSFEIKRKAFNEEEVKAKVRKAKTLLQSGRRNGALLLLNETLLHDLAVRSREKVKVIRSIALAFAAENNPDYTEPDKVRAHPKLYQGITVRWKGRLDRIFREGDGNWLIINHEMKSSQKNGAHFIFLAFIRKTIGDAIIGSQIEVLGEIISTTVTREFSNGLAKSIPIRVMARQLKIIAD